jgi:hypothetical protein
MPQIPPETWGSMETAGVAVQDSAMAGEWIAALRAVEALATALNDASLSEECRTREKLAGDSLEKMFWDSSRGYYNYGVGKSGEKVTYMNPAIGYSAWYGSLPESHAREVVQRLGAAQFLSDWGVRSMSLEDPRYDENSYQIGSAWPFFTVAPMIAEYRYHNAVQGFITWMAMIRLRQFNARGATPESMSGTYYRLLDNGVPHQMFSELLAMPGLIEGVMGMALDVPAGILHFTPHLPPAWPELAVQRFAFGRGQLSIEMHQSPGRLWADLNVAGDPLTELDFSPALPAGATVTAVKQDRKSIPFHAEDHESDIHVRVDLKSVTRTLIEVLYRGGVAADVSWQPLQEGDTSRNLHVLKTSYHAGQFQMLVEGRPDVKYEIRLWTPWRVESATSAETIVREGDWSVLEVAAPSDAAQHRDRAGYVRWTVDAKLKAN